MLVDLFDFPLPQEAIAQRPRPRGESRLLVLDRRAGSVSHGRFRDLPALLRPGDLLVRNDALVLPVRLLGRTRSGREAELLVVSRPSPREARCLVRPGRALRPGGIFSLPGGREATVGAALPDGTRPVVFSRPLEDEDIVKIGHVPLPPYIRRPDEPEDRERYQTVFARHAGAVAAPTAGLHFTREIFEALERRGVEIATLTLLVGPGTFRPVTAAVAEDHRLDAEEVIVPDSAARALERARSEGRRIVAVGTTVTRAIESWVRRPRERFWTDLYILPGFEFRATGALLTNFHLPRSTLLMLVSAFAGREPVLAAYAAAVAEGYLFYSYGDAMLIA